MYTKLFAPIYQQTISRTRHFMVLASGAGRLNSDRKNERRSDRRSAQRQNWRGSRCRIGGTVAGDTLVMDAEPLGEASGAGAYGK